MNLNKSGDRSSAIAQDFDTLQRNFNDLQAQLATAQAAITALQAAAAPTAPVISSANKVTSTTSGAISVGQGLTGDGTPAKPVAVDVDGSTVTVNSSNQLVAAGFTGVTLAASSGLTGAGTVASPLAANVDGSTITINGSNQLQGGVSYVFIAQAPTPTFGGTGPFTLSAHTTVATVSGVSGKVIIPLAMWSTAHQDDAGTVAVWSGSAGLELLYSGDSSTLWTSGITITYTSSGSHDNTCVDLKQLARVDGTTLNKFRGTSLIVRTNNGSDFTSTGAKTMNNNGTLTLLYALVSATAA